MSSGTIGALLALSDLEIVVDRRFRCCVISSLGSAWEGRPGGLAPQNGSAILASSNSALLISQCRDLDWRQGATTRRTGTVPGRPTDDGTLRAQRGNGGGGTFLDEAHLRRLSTLPGRWPPARDHQRGPFRDAVARHTASAHLAESAVYDSAVSRRAPNRRTVWCTHRRPPLGLRCGCSGHHLHLQRATAGRHVTESARPA